MSEKIYDTEGMGRAKNRSTKHIKVKQKYSTLAIPQRYQELYGYREVVTTYIENYFSRLEQESLDLKTHRSLMDFPWNNLYTTNYDRLLEKVTGDRYEPIANSAELKLSGTGRRLIYLHGRLREQGEPFGFDGCRDHHYVITQKDYDTYEKKHEAFTHLMRISFLQESFCFFGFSGADPNFQAWIKWVQDVLHKRRESREKSKPGQSDKYSIYLIGVGSDPLSEAEKLRYENIGICYVPLREVVWEEKTQKELTERLSE